MKNIFLYLTLSLTLFSCSGESSNETKTDENFDNQTENSEAPNPNLPDNFQIKGLIQGAVNQPLTLEAASPNGTIKLAQTTVGQDGSFTLKGNIQGMGIYQLRLGVMDNKVIPLTLSPNDKAVLKANYENYELLPVWEGTTWAKALTSYMEKFNVFAKKQLDLSNNQSLTQEQQIAEFMKLRKPVDDFAKAEIAKDLTNPANIVLSTSLTPSMGFEYWDEKNLELLKKLAVAYKGKYKESPIAESFQNQVKEIEKALADYKLSKSGKKVAPEISLQNPDGKTISLSSLRGKVVLVDFWASWCGPCRKENPNVVNMYNKYKNKGFTVYSVSLDSDAEAWRRAIKSDGLIWPNHVSDLKEWKSPLTQTYGFNSIPYTVLVGRDGKVIGTNLRGESLEQKLKEVL